MVERKSPRYCMAPMVTMVLDKNQEARELCEKGAWPAVLDLAKNWAVETPDDAKAWFYQGLSLSVMGRFLEAETSYRRSLKLDASDFKTWNNLAAILFDSLNCPANGIHCLTQALKLDPGNKLGWANLASMHGQMGRHQQALECAERALALDPHMVEAQLHRARAAQILGQADIVRAASEALARVPHDQFRRLR